MSRLVRFLDWMATATLEEIAIGGFIGVGFVFGSFALLHALLIGGRP